MTKKGVNGPAVEKSGLFASAWTLAALLLLEGEVALRALVTAMDALNHAVPEPEELREALARLAAGGCLEYREGLLQLTPAGEGLRTGGFMRAGLFGKVEAAQRVLEKRGLPPAGESLLSLEATESAVAEYLVGVWEEAAQPPQRTSTRADTGKELEQ